MIIDDISLSLQKGRAQEVKILIEDALKNNVSAKSILNDGLISGMTIIGSKFKNNEIFVPEVLIAARAMNAGLEILKPVLIDIGVEPIGKAIICTVKGDLHDIGKNLVKMMLEGQGIECFDLGVDVDPDMLVDAVRKVKPDLVCLSALLTTTMMVQKDMIDALVKAQLREKVKVLIGGAPVTESFAQEAKADGYSPDAASAAILAKQLLLK